MLKQLVGKVRRGVAGCRSAITSTKARFCKALCGYEDDESGGAAEYLMITAVAAATLGLAWVHFIDKGGSYSVTAKVGNYPTPCCGSRFLTNGQF